MNYLNEINSDMLSEIFIYMSIDEIKIIGGIIDSKFTKSKYSG